MYVEQPLTKALEKAQKELRRKAREAKKSDKPQFLICEECRKNRAKQNG